MCIRLRTEMKTHLKEVEEKLKEDFKTRFDEFTKRMFLKEYLNFS